MYIYIYIWVMSRRKSKSREAGRERNAREKGGRGMQERREGE
jgi:hypothetical protein